MIRNSLLSCQLNSCCAYNFKEGKFLKNKINIEGPFTSLKYNEKNGHVLISARANSKYDYMRQIVCSLEKSDDMLNLNTVHLFNGGASQKLLTRPCHINTANESLVAFYNETSKSMVFWSISTGKLMHTMPVDDTAIDSCLLEGGSANFSVLTSSNLHMYNFDQSVNM